MSQCRICNAPEPKTIGQYRPYQELQSFEVFDCETCGCRFVWRKEAVHETMHAADNSPYAFHKKLAQRMSAFYQKKEIKKAKKFLSKTKKYRFIIDEMGRDPEIKILELGCALGYLTAFFLMQGKDILGIDISNTAVSQASRLFGPHFQLMDDEFFIQNSSQFDFVFHTGTIGCVDDPIDFTKKALGLLKPGGKLLFNTPDVKAAREMQAIWVKGTPPPDLITLFDESFWRLYFQDYAEVSVVYEPYSHRVNAQKLLKRLFKLKYLSPESVQMFAESRPKRFISMVQFLVSLPVLVLSKVNLLPHFRNEFGMFVILTKKKTNG